MLRFIYGCLALLAFTSTLVFCPFVSADLEISWSTFLGSSSDDGGNSVAADDNGNVFVTGTSVAGWGTPINAYAGRGDAFLAKIYDLDIDDDGWPNDTDGAHWTATTTAPVIPIRAFQAPVAAG